MAKWLGIDKVVNLFNIIKHNGGIVGCIRTLYRTSELKFGDLVGEDKYGNKYYENNMYFYGRNRWVAYNRDLGSSFDASQVPAEWYGWLHYKSDLPPFRDPTRPRYKWMADHTPNMSGTKHAYVPYSTTKPKIEAWKPK